MPPPRGMGDFGQCGGLAHLEGAMLAGLGGEVIPVKYILTNIWSEITYTS